MADRQLMTEIKAEQGEIVDLLCQLVRIPGETGDEARIGTFVADYCRALGFEVSIVEAVQGRPNVFATWDSGRPGKALLLNDHLDNIPPGPLEFWTYPPYGARVAEGRVWGRGTIDTKSGLTTILVAARKAMAARHRLCGRLKLLFTCDEEVGGALGMRYLGEQGLIEADLALVTEPTSLGIEYGTKGRLGFEVTTLGVATHGARPHLGHNAIYDMSAVVDALRTYAASLSHRKHPVMGTPTLNVGTVNGGTVPNMVPNKCTIGVDRRLVPGETKESVLAEIQSVIDTVAARHPAMKVAWQETIWWPGYLIEREDSIVGLLSSSFKTVLGRDPVLAVKDAGTDASWINIFGKIPVVMFSPGHGPAAMNANENVAVDDLLAASAVVTQFVFDVLGAPPDGSDD